VPPFQKTIPSPTGRNANGALGSLRVYYQGKLVLGASKVSSLNLKQALIARETQFPRVEAKDEERMETAKP